MEHAEKNDRPIIVAVEDMFFAAKIRATAEACGRLIRFARSEEAVMQMARAERPALIIFDLHAQQFDPVSIARNLKSDAGLKDIPLLGFFSHVQTELEERARGAGFERVVPRSFFSKRLAEILRPGL